MKGWLDKYNDNANDGSSSAPDNWVGEGYSTKGRNYSPAWGGQFEDGGDLPQAQHGWWEELKNSSLNPYNWGVEDYSKEKDFNKAYSSAKKSGEKEFIYKGKRYSTKYAGTPRQEVGTYGIEGKPIDKKLLNTPTQANLYPPLGEYIPGHISAQVLQKGLPSVDYSSAGNNIYGIGSATEKGEKSYYSYGVDPNNFYQVAANLPEGIYNPGSKPSTWNLFTNNCADNTCDAYGIPRSPLLELPDVAMKKIKKKYPTLDVTGRTAADYVNLAEDLSGAKPKDVLSKANYILGITSSPEFKKNGMLEGVDKSFINSIQQALYESGYELPKSKLKERKEGHNFDGVFGKETEMALKDWQSKNKSFAMGGSLPGSVGFMYARTQGAAPSNGPYAKKTKASAENGMTYYQHGLDWKPKSMETGGWLDKYEVPKNQNAEYVLPSARDLAKSMISASESTAPTSKQTTTGVSKENMTSSSKAMGKAKRTEEKEKKATQDEIKAAKAFNKGKTKTFKFPTGEEKTLDQMNAREKMYIAGKSLEGVGSIGNEGSFFNEYLNPATFITNAAGALGEAPYEAKQSNSNMPYLSAIATPLIGGAMGFDPLGSTIKTAEHPLISTIPSVIKHNQYGPYGEALFFGAANKVAPIVSNTPGLNMLYKKAAEKVGAQSAGAFRNLSDLKNIFKKTSDVYKGTMSSESDRNLLRNYIYGDTRGFVTSDIPTTGLEKYTEKYGPLKKYQLDVSTIGDQPINIKAMANNPFASELLTNKGIFKKGMLIDEKYEALKNHLRDIGNIQFGVTNSNLGIDDIGGHMKFLRYDPTTDDIMMKTQDLWKFAPKDYVKRYHTHVDRELINSDPINLKNYLKEYSRNKQASLMEKAGKPFVLIDERPVKLDMPNQEIKQNLNTTLNLSKEQLESAIKELNTDYNFSDFQSLKNKPRLQKQEKGGNIPKNQNAKFTLPNSRDLARQMTSTSSSIPNIQEQLKQKAQAEEIARRVAATNKQQFIGQAKASTPYSEAKRQFLNQQYTSQLPNAQIDEQGNISRVNPNRSVTGEAENFMSRREDKAAEHALGALEAAGAVEGLGALGSAARNAIAESMESGLLSRIKGYKPIETPSVGRSFKSEIDWGKWNSEIPSNQTLMDEYHAIEQQAKANGTWMKNPDGSDFVGTNPTKEELLKHGVDMSPEQAIQAQFIQQNSKNIPKNVIRNADGSIQGNYHGSKDSNITEFKEEYFNQGAGRGLFGKGNYTTKDKGYAQQYLGLSKGDATTPEGKVYSLYINSENPISARAEDLFREYGQGTKDIFKNIDDFPTRQQLAEKYNLTGNKDEIIDKMLAHYYETPREIKKIPFKENDYLEILGMKSGQEQVTPFNNYLKSAIGNNGMFDMKNPNIYKSIISGLGLGALGKGAISNSNTEVPKQKKGGVIKDDRGQWAHPGEITEIGSNRITMQGVPYPVLGISDKGDTQMMLPGEEYKFKGKKVTEIPMAQKGKQLIYQKQNPNVPKGWLPLTSELAKGRYSGSLKDMYYNPTGSTTGDSAISYFAPPKVDKPEPTLKKKILNVEPIQSSLNTINPQLRTIEQPNIQLPSVQRGEYRTSYYDPEIKDWNERAFMSQEESDKFAQEMSQRGFPGSYGNVTQTKKVNQKSTGGWLDKYK